MTQFAARRGRSVQRHLLALAAATAALLVLFVVPASASFPDHAAEIDPAEHELMRAINEFRADHGLGRLEPNIGLQRAADAQSYYILDHDWFNHSSRNGTTFVVRVRRFVRAHRLGETLAWSAASASRRLGWEIATQWLHSPAHRSELMNGSYTRIGVARRGGSLGGTRANVFTADFASG